MALQKGGGKYLIIVKNHINMLKNTFKLGIEQGIETIKREIIVMNCYKIYTFNNLNQQDASALQ